MREVDDRYPEFARPWEPVKGGKHYKKLTASALPLTAALLVAIGLTMDLPKPEAAAPVSVPTEIIETVPVTDPPVVSHVPVDPPTPEPDPEIHVVQPPNNNTTPNRPHRYDPHGYPEKKTDTPTENKDPDPDPPVTDPPVTVPPVTDPPVTVPPVTNPPVTVPPVTNPPVTVPPVTDPPVTVPPVTNPPVTVPPVTNPPVTDPPVTVPPVTNPPVTVPPVTNPPVTVPPVTDPPVTDPPVTRKDAAFTVNPHVDYDELDAGAVFYDVDLNDLKGGSCKATLYRKDGSTWVALTGSGSSADYVYDEYEDYWTVNDYGSEGLLYYSPPLNGDMGAAAKVKVVFEYTYPDGTTGTYESDPLPFHNGQFADFDYDYGSEGWDYLWTTGDLFFDILIRDDLVDPGSVEVHDYALWDDDAGVMISATPTITKSQDSYGRWHMVFDYHFDRTLHEGNFHFSVILRCQEDAYNHWDSDIAMEFSL